MKKYLVFSAIFLTSFLLISNVKAASIGTVQIPKEYFDNYFHSIYDLDISSKSNLSMQEIIDSFKTKLEYNSETEDYFIFYIGQYGIYMYTWKKSQEFSYPIGVFFNKNSSGKLISYFYGYTNSKMKYISYNYSSNTYNPVSSVPVINGNNNIFINSGTISNGIYNGSGSLKHQYFSSSVDVVVSNYNNNNGYYDLIVDDGTLCHTLNAGSVLFKSDGSLNIESPKPKITFKEVEKGYEDESKNKLLFHKIGINFSVYDTEKYIYFYRTSLQNDKTWNSISNNDFEYTAFSDQTLYVAIIDRQKYEKSAENGQELVFDYIATATYTFDKLSSTIPELSFNTNTPDSCYMTINGKKETVCKNLNIKISNYNDLNKYLWEYSINDSQNFKPTYSNNFTLYLDDNVTIYFRLLDREKNEYIKYATYKMAGISQNISSIGPYVNLHGEYKEKEYYYEVTVYYYNYDSNLYNYYYSVDREKWTEINPIDLSIYSSNSTNKTYYNQYKVYQDCTFYLKIEDKNGNFVKAATLTIDSFGKNNTPKNILQNIKSIFDEKTGIFNKVNEIYNIMRNSKIGVYIFVVISGSIIILLIKGIKS